jgi:hypothetical protein
VPIGQQALLRQLQIEPFILEIDRNPHESPILILT